MTIYLVLPIIYLFFMIIEDKVLKYVDKKVWLFILLFPLIIMTAFKYESVGSDTLAYKWLYNIFANQSLTSSRSYNVEIGFRFISRLFGGILKISFQNFQIIYSIFIYFSIGVFLNRHTKKNAFVIFFFIAFRLFFFSMTGIRQMISISIFLLSTKYLQKKKFLPYLILIILATSFHSSSFIFILLYFLPFKEINSKSIFKIALLSIIMFLTSDLILSLFLRIFPKYSSYLVRIDLYEGIFVYLQTMLIFILILPGLLSSKNNINDETKNNKTNVLVLNATIFSFFISLFSIYINISGRVVKYLLIFIPIYLILEINKIKKTNDRMILKISIVLVLLVYYYMIIYLRPEWDGIIPYRF